MDKARVIEFYKIDDQGYQSTCTIIGLKNPPTLTGEQLDQFDRIRGWLDNKEVSNYQEAQERFRLEQEKESFSWIKSEAWEKEIQEALNPLIEEQVNSCLEEFVSLVKNLKAELWQVALDAVSEHVAKHRSETKGC
jgi:hypothetical protein